MRHTRARPVALTLTAVMVAGLLGACGSSSSTSSSSSASATGSASGAAGPGGGPANRAKLVACLKQHGVTLPSRPPGAGGGGRPPGSGGGDGGGTGSRRRFFGGGGGGGFRANPKLRAAFQACGGGRGFARHGGQGLSHTSIQKFVTCVRQHGYDLPAPNFSGKGSVFPAKIEGNAKFQSASRACRSALRPPNGGAPPSGA